jgi:hypothetical protein
MLGILFLVLLLSTALRTWQQLDVISTEHRLLNIALMIACGYVGGECMRRGQRR